MFKLRCDVKLYPRLKLHRLMYNRNRSLEWLKVHLLAETVLGHNLVPVSLYDTYWQWSVGSAVAAWSTSTIPCVYLVPFPRYSHTFSYPFCASLRISTRRLVWETRTMGQGQPDGWGWHARYNEDNTDVYTAFTCNKSLRNKSSATAIHNITAVSIILSTQKSTVPLAAYYI